MALILIASSLSLSLIQAQPARAAAESTGGVFVPLTPTRLIDTAADGGTLGAGSTRSYQILGQGPVPTTGVSAVVVDIAVKNATATGVSYLTAWGTDDTKPSSATMYYSGDTAPRSNTTIVKMGNSGSLSVYNYSGSADIDIDVQGYFTAVSGEGSPGGFVAINPERVANTVSGQGVPAQQLAVGSPLDVQITNGATITSDATSVFANIIVDSVAPSGNLRIGRGGVSAASLPATVNYQDNGPVSSGVVLPLSSDGKIRVLNYAGGPVHFKVDILGYFSGDSTKGGSYNSITPAPVYSTLGSNYPSIGAGETRAVKVAGVAGIPEGGKVGAIAMNITARNWTADGTLTVFSPYDSEPTARNLHFRQGEGRSATSTLAIAKLSDEGWVMVRNTSTAPVDFQAAAQGWFGATDVADTVEPDLPRLDPLPQVFSVTDASGTAQFAVPVPDGGHLTLDASGSGAVSVYDAANVRLRNYTARVLDANSNPVAASVSLAGQTPVVTYDPAAVAAFPVGVILDYTNVAPLPQDDVEQGEVDGATATPNASMQTQQASSTHCVSKKKTQKWGIPTLWGVNIGVRWCWSGGKNKTITGYTDSWANLYYETAGDKGPTNASGVTIDSSWKDSNGSTKVYFSFRERGCLSFVCGRWYDHQIRLTLYDGGSFDYKVQY